MPGKRDNSSNDLSEFEKQRLANIAERDALLKKLTLEAQSSGLHFPQPPLKAVSGDGSKSRKRTSAKKEDTTPVPRRMSSRLRGLTADSEVKRKADEAFEAAQEAEREKRMRKSDFFTFDSMLISGQKISGKDLVGIDVISKGVAKPYERTFGEKDVKMTKDKDLKELREQMSGLRLWELWDPNRIKITPERIYSMTFHPSEAKPLIFAGDKMGHLGVIDASQERLPTEGDEDPDPSVTTLKPHTRPISTMSIHPSKPTHLYTASYDSSIREMDLEKMTSMEKFAPDSPNVDEPISGIDMAANDPHCLYWTTLDGSFGRYDVRAASRNTTVARWQLSEKKIGGFSLFPSQSHYLATASLDRFMRLWDLRKLSHENPVPVGEHESRLSVSHAAFNSAGQVATSSYDDTLKIFDFGRKGISSWEPGRTVSDTDMKPDTAIRHNCQTGRWVTITDYAYSNPSLRPQWQQNPQSPIPRFCIGNMNRFVDVYSGNGDQLAQLGGEVTAVPAVAVFHRSKNWVVGGTARGKVCLWI
ncbi:WD40-repeat-containing domain protein [Elaphomyces granulatus]